MTTTLPVNLTVNQGSTFSIDFNLKDENNDYIDLTGYNAVGLFARNYYSTTTSYSLNAEIPVGSETVGLVRLSLSAIETSALKAGRYVYTVNITNDTQTSTDRYIEGVLTVNPGVL